MLWLPILGWALGVSVVVLAFAVGIAARKVGIAAALFILGVVLVAGSVLAGTRHTDTVHGIRPDAPPYFSTPGGT
jgi:phosphate/sulfate permease